MSAKLTNDEIALYDRQIRLWGMEAQQRLRSANILLINLSGVGTEVAKNLVLGGIGALTVLDSHTVIAEDLSCQFFQTEADIGTSRVGAALARIQELNNRVVLTSETRSLSDVDEVWFGQFDIVIATELGRNEIVAVNDACRRHRVPFYAAGLHGLFGYVFVDLIEHRSTKVKPVNNKKLTPVGTVVNGVKTVVAVEAVEDKKVKPTEERVTVLDTYRPFRDTFLSTQLPQQLNRRQLKQLTPALPIILALFSQPRPAHVSQTIETFALSKEEVFRATENERQNLKIPTENTEKESRYVEMLSTQAFCEFSPVAAILGGSLAQDVINMLAGKESPINNFMVLDGTTSEMPIFHL